MFDYDKSNSSNNSFETSNVRLIDESASMKCLSEKPKQVIKGGTSIKNFHVLNDKRFIVTKDSDENVCVYDVLKVIIGK